jgi:hypothetical protein
MLSLTFMPIASFLKARLAITESSAIASHYMQVPDQQTCLPSFTSSFKKGTPPHHLSN